jgi:hypothetical protein
MKKILPVIIALLGAQASFAQVAVGIESGLQMSRFRMEASGTIVKSDMTAGLRAGATVDIPVNAAFHIQAGLSYVGMGGRDKIETKDMNGTMLGYTPVVTRLNYLQMPLSFTYMNGKVGANRFFLGAGPYLAYTLSGWQYYQGARGELIVGNDKYCDISTIDAGFQLNAGYLFAKGLYARAYYMRGLTNNWPDQPDYSLRNVGFGLSLGYNLPM